jgi:hypothetical protein
MSSLLLSLISIHETKGPKVKDALAKRVNESFTIKPIEDKMKPLPLAPKISHAQVLKPVYAALRFRGVRVVFYIDDALVIGETAEQCSLHSQEVCELLSRLGYAINPI